MLARKGSDSNRSKRYIFDVIVFSAKHKKKLPYWEFFYGAAKKSWLRFARRFVVARLTPHRHTPVCLSS